MTDTSTSAAGGRRPMLIAAAAAAAALLAGGIALVATGGDDDPPRLDLAAGAGAPAAASAGGDSGRYVESAELAADDMAGTSMMAWVRYVAGDELPDLGGSAPVYRLVAGDDDLRALADHFGVDGEVTEADGMQRTISEGDAIVGRYGASWWYTSGQEYPGASDQPVASDCGAGPDAVCEEPAPMPPPERPANMPSQAEAEAIVRGIAEAAGLDLTDARVTSYDNTSAWGVTIELALDGTIIPGWSVYGTVTAGGEVLDAGGALGAREQLSDYPLDTTRVAIDRLNEQSGGGGTGAEEPAIEPAPADGADGADGDAATSDRAEPAPDEVTIMPVEGDGDGEPMTVTLRTAELSYAMVGNADGTETYLVPTYLLDGENDRGEEWLDVFAIAVQAEFLAA